MAAAARLGRAASSGSINVGALDTVPEGAPVQRGPSPSMSPFAPAAGGAGAGTSHGGAGTSQEGGGGGGGRITSGVSKAPSRLGMHSGGQGVAPGGGVSLPSVPSPRPGTTGSMGSADFAGSAGSGPANVVTGEMPSGGWWLGDNNLFEVPSNINILKGDLPSEPVANSSRRPSSVADGIKRPGTSEQSSRGRKGPGPAPNPRSSFTPPTPAATLLTAPPRLMFSPPTTAGSDGSRGGGGQLGSERSSTPGDPFPAVTSLLAGDANPNNLEPIMEGQQSSGDVWASSASEQGHGPGEPQQASSPRSGSAHSAGPARPISPSHPLRATLPRSQTAPVGANRGLALNIPTGYLNILHNQLQGTPTKKLTTMGAGFRSFVPKGSSKGAPRS